MEPRISFRPEPLVYPIPLPSPRQPSIGTFDVTFVLLVVQAGIGLVSALGTVVVGLFLGLGPLVAGGLALSLVGPIVALWLAKGVVRRRRWARNATVWFELALIAGLVVRLAIGRDQALGLMPLLTGVVLPLAVLGLLLNRNTRKAIVRKQKPAEIERLEHFIGPVQQAA